MKLPPREPGVGSDKPDEFIELPDLGKYSILLLSISFQTIKTNILETLAVNRGNSCKAKDNKKKRFAVFCYELFLI
jgi:hypothetical protein